MNTRDHLNRLARITSDPIFRERWTEALESLDALQDQIATLENERNLLKEQRRRAHALIDKIMDVVDSAGLGPRSSDWDVLDSSVRQIVIQRDALKAADGPGRRCGL